MRVSEQHTSPSSVPCSHPSPLKSLLRRSLFISVLGGVWGRGRVWDFWGGTVFPSVVLFIRHLCVRIIMGRVCLVCEGAVDSSTHSCHIPRYEAKQNGTCRLVEKSRWDWSYQTGGCGRAGQGPTGAAHGDWGLWEGRAGPDRSSSHTVVLIPTGCARPTQLLALSGCSVHFELRWREGA